MANAPPAVLLRLREADVVRLCGFASAARGLELADRHAVTGGAREGCLLRATVADERDCHVTVELPGDGGAGAMRWTCSAHANASPSDLGCAHVAALLTAWIRAPGDFPAANPPGTAPPAPAAPPVAAAEPPPRPQVSQPALMPATRVPRSLGSSLADELLALPAVELLAIARRVLAADLSEHEARDALALALTDSDRLSALLARLDPGARQLFASLLLLGGVITATDLDALAQRSGRTPSGMRAELAVLARHGLVFSAPGSPPAAPASGGSAGPHSWRELSGWRIPPEVRAAFTARLPLDPLPARGTQGLPIASGGELTETTAQRALRVERASLRPLLLALALLARAPAPLGPFSANRPDDEPGSNAPPTTAAGQAMGRGAHWPVPIAPGRLAALARAAGLDPAASTLARRVLQLAEDSAPGQPLTDLARAPREEHQAVAHAGFRLWRDAEEDGPVEMDAEAVLAGELAGQGAASESAIRLRLDTAHPAYRPGILRSELAQGRRFVVRLLAGAEPGAWYALDEFVALVWRLDPLFLRARQQAHERPVWWLEAVRPADGVSRPLRPTAYEDWLAGEGVYVRRMLAETLRAWGALDLAYDVAGRRVAFRLAPFGRVVLTDQAEAPQAADAPADGRLAEDWGPAALPTRSGDLAVQPLAAGADLLDALDRWAYARSLAGGRLIYVLSRDLACAAFDRGVSADELSRQLRAADSGRGERAAALVAQRLAEWRTEYARTRIYEGWALLEAHDEPTLVEALALVPGLAARCHRLDAACALVPPDDLAVLRPLLARRGYPV